MSTHDSNRSIATKIIEKVPRNFGQLKSPRNWAIEKVPINFGQLKNNEHMMLRIAEILENEQKTNKDLMLRIAEILENQRKINEDLMSRMTEILKNDNQRFAKAPQYQKPKKEEAGSSDHFFQNQKPKTETKTEKLDKSKIRYETNRKFQKKGQEKGGVATAVNAGDAIKTGEKLRLTTAAAAKLQHRREALPPPRHISTTAAHQNQRRSPNPTPHQARRRRSPGKSEHHSSRHSAAALGKRSKSTRSGQLEEEKGKKNDHRSCAKTTVIADGKLKMTMTSSMTSPGRARSRNGLDREVGPNDVKFGPRSGLGPLNGPGLGAGPVSDKLKEENGPTKSDGISENENFGEIFPTKKKKKIN
ncbi:hypothetical protein CASFOL_030906 [Castilleja foliolosa]|uniref:Uncharacterized protein n=1 Tax=Castilleja foliolosa TaxID=1961234 RepID=A0ABD3C7A6_9LAMI